jgi:hypothetical protein
MDAVSEGVMAKQQIEIRYEEASLQNVLQYFADQYKAPAGTNFLLGFDGSNRVEWFVDAAQGRVIFKLFLQSREGGHLGD